MYAIRSYYGLPPDRDLVGRLAAGPRPRPLPLRKSGTVHLFGAQLVWPCLARLYQLPLTCEPLTPRSMRAMNAFDPHFVNDDGTLRDPVCGMSVSYNFV